MPATVEEQKKLLSALKCYSDELSPLHTKRPTVEEKEQRAVLLKKLDDYMCTKEGQAKAIYDYMRSRYRYERKKLPQKRTWAVYDDCCDLIDGSDNMSIDTASIASSQHSQISPSQSPKLNTQIDMCELDEPPKKLARMSARRADGMMRPSSLNLNGNLTPQLGRVLNKPRRSRTQPTAAQQRVHTPSPPPPQLSTTQQQQQDSHLSNADTTTADDEETPTRIDASFTHFETALDISPQVQPPVIDEPPTPALRPRAKSLDRRRYANAKCECPAVASTNLNNETCDEDAIEYEKHYIECKKAAELLHEQRVRAQLPVTIRDFAAPFSNNRASFKHFVEHIREAISQHFLAQADRLVQFDSARYGEDQLRQANNSMRTTFAHIDSSDALCRFVRDYVSVLSFASVLDLSSRIDEILNTYQPPKPRKRWFSFCRIQ